MQQAPAVMSAAPMREESSSGPAGPSATKAGATASPKHSTKASPAAAGGSHEKQKKKGEEEESPSAVLAKRKLLQVGVQETSAPSGVPPAPRATGWLGVAGWQSNAIGTRVQQRSRQLASAQFSLPVPSVPEPLLHSSACYQPLP